jgi:hypothetical protein
MAKLELKIDSREVWSAYADRLYSGDKIVKSITEMLQNSVDAGASRVNISIAQNGDKTWSLVFEDDGRGMSADVFLNRFLCLGGKGESTGDRTGGNGVAKAVILFNRLVADFSIRSVSADGRGFIVRQNDILSGAELVEGNGSKSGVIFEIQYKSDAYIQIPSLKRMLSFAKPRATEIILNGEVIRFSGNPSELHSEIVGYPVYKVNDDLEMGGEYKGYNVVLSNGLPQFVEYTGSDETYLVDFTPTTFRDFTPARERLANDLLEKAFRRLKDRVTYERENPVSSKIPKQKVQKRFTYNFRKSKAKKEQFVIKQPDHLPEMIHQSFAPVLEDDRIAALVTSGIRSQVESEEKKSDDLLSSLIESRGVIFEDRSSMRREWHPENVARFRKILVLMDRYIEIFEQEFSDLEVANIGLMRSCHSHDAHWSSEDKAILIDVEKLEGKFSVVALRLLNTLTHELSHRWEYSHNERFASRQAQLLDVVAENSKKFSEARKSVRRIR